MICLDCGHYSYPDSEMAREQGSNDCQCRCHPWNNGRLLVRGQFEPGLKPIGNDGFEATYNVSATFHPAGCLCPECDDREAIAPGDYRYYERRPR